MADLAEIDGWMDGWMDGWVEIVGTSAANGRPPHPGHHHQ